MIESRDVIGLYCPLCGEIHNPRYDKPQYLKRDENGDEEQAGVFFYCRQYKTFIVALFTLYRLIEGKYKQDFIDVEIWKR